MAVVVFFVFLLLAAPAAQAAMHEQMAISPRAIALGNAVTADPPGVMALHYNPAGLARIRGKLLDLGITYPSITIKARFEAPKGYRGFFGYDVDPVAGTETETAGGAINLPFNGPVSTDILLGPETGFAWHPPGSRWTVGIGLYAPFAVGFEYPPGPAVYDAQYLYQQRLVFSPGIGYKITDTLYAGLSVGIGSAAMGVRMDMRAPNDLVALTGVLGDLTQGLSDIITLGLIPFPLFGGGLDPYESFGRMTATNLQDNLTTSYNIGLLWEPVDWFAAGIVYQSECKAKFGGTFTLEYSKRWQSMMNWFVSNEILGLFSEALGLPTNGGIPFQRGRATIEFEFPRRVQVGIKVKPIKQLKLLVDANWVQWSSMKENVFVFDQDIQLLKLAHLLAYKYNARTLVLPRYMKDTIHYHFGAEIMPLDWLTLRLGYEFRPSSVNKKYADLMFALPDLTLYSCGLGFQLTRNTELDFSFSLVKGEDLSYRQEDGTTSSLLNRRDFTALIYNPYAGLDVYQETNALIFSTGIQYSF
ncbi:MAG: outer membrane protein transport protein [Thermodesulfobacteriota bacterium]